MLEFKLATREDRPLRVLCLGAHCDDIEIGCGGTILQQTKNNREIVLCWVVFSSDQQRRKEASKSANMFLKHAKEKTVVINNFRNSFFPYIGGEIKEYFETLKQAFSPDLIFTHNRHDLHQDHRLISEQTWETFRDNMILEYEIPKYDGDLGSPNCYVHLDETICKRKVQYILDTFATQREKQWFTAETFFSILRLRGIESNAPTNYAEAFYCRKALLG
jgi:LmbE family N-acetylglucosaminyl deacetylase